MNKNLKLIVAMLALAGLCCAISLITVRTAAPSLLASHVVSLAAGASTLALMMAIGQNRLSMAGLMISLCVGGMCLCCFIEGSDYGFNKNLVVFGRQILEPSFFLVPSLILLFAWARRKHQGTLFFATATIAALLLAAFMPNLSEATLVLVLAAALFGLVVRIRRHKTIYCLIAAAIALSPFAVREVQMQMSGRSWFGPNSLIGSYTIFSWHMVANSPWIRTQEVSRTLPPVGNINGNILGFASHYCGNWTLVVLAVALILLAICLAVAARRTRTATQRILVVGAATALTTQMALGFLHFFFLIPRHASHIPFVSTGGCHTVSCFALLGLAIAALRDDRATAETIKRRHQIDTCVCGALLVAITTAGAMLYIHKMSLPLTQIARILPENKPGCYFDAKNGILENGLAFVPVKQATGIGEPSVVVALAAFHDKEQIWEETISREPPVVAAKCRVRPDGRIAVDCRDLYEDEFTLVFKQPNGGIAKGTTDADARWRISIDPQGHFGCTNLWTDARVTQAISKNLNLDCSFVSNALSRADSRYIKLKITSDPDEVECARRNRRFWRLIIKEEPSAKNQ